ncbi:DNA-3-methyladenine glycosylase family protein [Paenibacillus sp. NPDC056579]|uniref:DNA-3-methyladenine glycosylase family protein n=1 Tax=Paenibacillus sp. NPDC056579 TaxID=3345871 RepID=UPI0036A83C53
MNYTFDLHPKESRVRQLSLMDPRFAELAEVIGSIKVQERTDGFEFLAKSLIGQQLSVKAADTICRRVEQNRGITADSMLAAQEDDLRTAGVSRPKIFYIKGLAQMVKQNELDFQSMNGMSNEEVLDRLMKVKGIGRWTAEMFLIFFLGREDVLSLGDAGLRRSAHWLYEGETGSSPTSLEHYSNQWKPYRTVACLYLWEAVNRGHVGAGSFRDFQKELAKD